MVALLENGRTGTPHSKKSVCVGPLLLKGVPVRTGGVRTKGRG